MAISISQIKGHSISIDQDIYATSVVGKYLDTNTVKTSKSFYDTTFPYNMIFTKYDASTSGEQVDKLTSKSNIHYIVFIGSLIYLLSARVDFSFTVHKLAKFSSNNGRVKV